MKGSLTHHRCIAATSQLHTYILIWWSHHISKQKLFYAKETYILCRIICRVTNQRIRLSRRGIFIPRFIHSESTSPTTMPQALCTARGFCFIWVNNEPRSRHHLMQLATNTDCAQKNTNTNRSWQTTTNLSHTKTNFHIFTFAYSLGRG